MPTSVVVLLVEYGLSTLAAQMVVSMAITFAVSTIASRFLTPNGNQSAGQPDPGARIQVPPDTTRPIPLVYGSAYIGGKFVDAVLRNDQQVIYYVMALSCISESGQFSYDTTKMYYGDRLITFDESDPTKVYSLTDGAGNVDTSISDWLYINLYISDKAGNVTCLNGGPLPWAADSDFSMGSNLLSPESQRLPVDQQWTETGRRMNGLAFAIVRLSYNREAGTTQLSPVTFHVTQNLFNSGTCTPGAAWYDYMTNSVYGAAVDPQFVDEVSAQTLDTYSNQLITFKDYEGDEQTQPRYRINGVIDTGQSILQNVDQIMTACDSWMQYNAETGKWAVVVNKAEATSFAFDDSNIVDAITVGSVDIAQTPNQIEAKFPDSTNRDQYNYVYEVVPSELMYPNEPTNKLSVSYDLVNDSVQALYLANRTLEQAREDLLVTINTTYNGIQILAGDVVSITNAAYGWNNKLFRAMQVKEAISADGMLGAQLQLIEYNAQVYDDKDITQFTPVANSGLVSSNFFSTLTAPTVTDQQPSAAVPSFSVDCLMPSTGRITVATLYYTTVSSPTASDWTLLGVQNATNSIPFTNGAILKFTHVSLPTNAYYFAFTVGNDVGQSQLSPLSTVYNWLPTPTTTAVAASFIAAFSPAVLQVPYNVSPNFTGVIASLYGTTSGGSIDFVASQNDTDAAFVNNTWRIGATSTSGYGDIVKTNITIGNPTDGGTFALFPQPTAMSGNPATIQVPVRYKDPDGNVSQGATASLQYSFNITGPTGATGTKYATAFLYQWATTTPSNPNGTSTYTWATGANTSYTGTNGWDVVIPANPGTPSIQLYSASKGLNAAGTDVTTTVSWSSGFSVQSVGANGAAGLQTANPTVFQWAATIPSGPTGTSVYTWASNTFTPIPSGWSDSPGTSPSPGYTLWGATVNLVDSSAIPTSTINWTTASITARGYSGQAGASSRICYASTTSSSLNSTPTTYTTTGNSSFPPYNTWGGSETWVATPPSITAGQSVYQSDGIYSPVTDNTVWNVPYLSNLKVGELSAITANLGTVNAGNINGVTITGGLLQTSSTGFRTIISSTDNSIRTIASGGYNTITIGGTNPGGILGDTRAAGTTYPLYQGYQSTPGGTDGYNIPTMAIVNVLGDAISGISEVNGIGLLGTAWKALGSTNHGIRGVNLAIGGGISTGGLVGVANGYDFYADGGGTNYGPFTGAHDVMIPINQNIPIGYIMVDVKCLVKKNLSNTIFEVTSSSYANQVAIGILVINNGLLANQTPASFIEKYESVKVEDNYIQEKIMYSEYYEYKDIYNYCAVNAVGEGQIYVCGENGNIAAGDLIVTSSIAGVGMKQFDNIVKNITVAKAREAVNFDDPTIPQLVACIYLCG
jgi:hypothetical protein